jgi:hypothetical protein
MRNSLALLNASNAYDQLDMDGASEAAESLVSQGGMFSDEAATEG